MSPDHRHDLRSTPALIVAGALMVAVAPALWAGRADAAPAVGCLDCIFGASNTNAVAGHGRLTAAFSADGDLTVLAWPSPSLYDQLCYISSNAADAKQQLHHGAHPGMGSFIGLWVTTAAGSSLTWLRDKAWTHTQRYRRSDGAVPVTVFKHASLGLTVTLTDVISADADLLTRHVELQRAAGSPVSAAALMVYENLSPTLSRVPQLPFADWVLDSRNDYLAAWDAASGAILHFHPGDRGLILSTSNIVAAKDVDFGPADALMKQAAPAATDVQQLVAGLDKSYAAGVAALVTTLPAPSAYQVGADATPFCDKVNAALDNILALPKKYPSVTIPFDPLLIGLLKCKDRLSWFQTQHGWQHLPTDALADAADGSLSGSQLSAAQTNGALMTPLSFSAQGRAEAEVLFAFGATRTAARAALESADKQPYAKRLAAAEAAYTEAVGSLALPAASLGQRVRQVAQRALVNIHVARVRKSGAIVASVTRQSPYYLDWPRDGAFFSAALDVAGRHDWVTQRMTWYRGLMRDKPTNGDILLNPKKPVDPETGYKVFPAHAWEMNYYSDGEPGGPIRFEIDNTALHVWSVVFHAAALQGQAREAFIDQQWPTLKQALDLLARWRDPQTKLTAPANEDDNAAYSSTLHGASTVYGALTAGARLAHHRGDEATSARYLARAQELGAAIRTHYYQPGSQTFRLMRPEAPGPISESIGYQVTGWLVWPVRLLDRDDPALQAQITADMKVVLDILEGRRGWGIYPGKPMVAAALYGDAAGKASAEKAVKLLASAATPGTDHFGETFATTLNSDGSVSYENMTAPPHVWEGALFYLAAMALTRPERFDLDRSAFPLPGDQPAEAGCGCAAGPRDAAGGGLALLLVAAIWLLARRSTSRRWAGS